MITYVVIAFLVMIIGSYIYENKRGKYPKAFIQKKFINNIFAAMAWGIIMLGLCFLAMGGVCAIAQMQDASFASRLSDGSIWTTAQWVSMLDGFSVGFTFLVCIGMLCLVILANKAWDIEIRKYTDAEKEIIANRKKETKEQFAKKCPTLAKCFKGRNK